MKDKDTLMGEIKTVRLIAYFSSLTSLIFQIFGLILSLSMQVHFIMGIGAMSTVIMFAVLMTLESVYGECNAWTSGVWGKIIIACLSIVTIFQFATAVMK